MLRECYRTLVMQHFCFYAELSCASFISKLIGGMSVNWALCFGMCAVPPKPSISIEVCETCEGMPQKGRHTAPQHGRRGVEAGQPYCLIDVCACFSLSPPPPPPLPPCPLFPTCPLLPAYHPTRQFLVSCGLEHYCMALVCIKPTADSSMRQAVL